MLRSFFLSLSLLLPFSGITGEEKSFFDFKHESMRKFDSIDGWCSRFKASFLMDLVAVNNAQKVVEIGVWGGRSLIPMALAVKFKNSGMVFGIDPWSRIDSEEGQDAENKDWWSTVDHDKIYHQFLSHVFEFGVNQYVTVIKTNSQNAPLISDIDILHIDGNHSDKASMIDVLKWVPQVKIGGFIVFDDTNWGSNIKAINWLNINCLFVGDYKDELNSWGVWVKHIEND
jgi:hypothetical protein